MSEQLTLEALVAETIVMMGFLHFLHGGARRSAPVKIIFTPLNAGTFTCDMEVTYANQAHTARFTAPRATEQDLVSQMRLKIALNRGVGAATRTWPYPWSVLDAVRLELNPPS